MSDLQLELLFEQGLPAMGLAECQSNLSGAATATMTFIKISEFFVLGCAKKVGPTHS
jgi:hypothetical protein